MEFYPNVASMLRITVFDVAPHILGVYDKALYEYATEHMLERGIRISTNCIIEKVDRTNLHVKGQNAVPYGVLLWVAGNKSVPFVDNLDVKKTEHGLVRILTDSMLRVKKKKKKDGDMGDPFYPDVFALGDAADVEGQSLPTTAEAAVQKSKYLVGQLNKRTEGTMPFAYQSRRLVTYIGGHDGIAEGLRTDELWSGREAWLSWRSGSFTWTRTWRNWLSLIFAMTLNFLFGRDVSRL